METCSICGLPKDLCVCQEIAKERQKIVVRTESKKFRKVATIIENLDASINLRMIGKQLKRKLACGGTIKDNHIELQGDHKDRVKKYLIELNFPEDQIEIR